MKYPDREKREPAVEYDQTELKIRKWLLNVFYVKIIRYY